MFRRTVELIVERAKKGIDMKSDHFVHAHTGPGACCEFPCAAEGVKCHVCGVRGVLNPLAAYQMFRCFLAHALHVKGG